MKITMVTSIIFIISIILLMNIIEIMCEREDNNEILSSTSKYATDVF